MTKNSPWLEYGSPDPRNLDRFLRRLTKGGCRPVAAAQPRLIHFFDTFDWRLHRKGRVLAQVDSSLRLYDSATGALLAEVPMNGGPPPRFYWDLKDCPLRRQLEPLIKVRALLHLVTIAGSSRPYELQHPKTGRHWRLEHRSLRLVRKGKETPYLEAVRLRPVGDRDEGRDWIDRAARKSGLEPVPPILLNEALKQARIRPEAYSCNVEVEIGAVEPVTDVFVRIARHLTENMTANLWGIRQDVDTEFLHDFRVSVRRTRTLLSLLKKPTLPVEAARDAKRDLEHLGRLTGPLRDLDVYLLRYPDYLALLPQEFHSGLRELFEAAHARRTEAHETLAKRIDDGELKDILARLEKCLDREAEECAAVSEAGVAPIGPVAAALITRGYHGVADRKARPDGEFSDEGLHHLRIRCKKLRYTLEFFAPLYPRREIKRLTKSLKRLQDHLGDHNDVVNQLADLDMLLQGKGRHRLSPQAAAAAGALLIKLAERRDELRSRFQPAFDEFSSSKTAHRIAQLTGKAD